MNKKFVVGGIYSYPFSGVIFEVVEINKGSMKVTMRNAEINPDSCFVVEVEELSPIGRMSYPACEEEIEIFNNLIVEEDDFSSDDTIMTPIEDYFFTHNIQVWSTKISDKFIWFSTNAGQYVRNELGQLFREGEGVTERVV